METRNILQLINTLRLMCSPVFLNTSHSSSEDPDTLTTSRSSLSVDGERITEGTLESSTQTMSFLNKLTASVTSHSLPESLTFPTSSESSFQTFSSFLPTTTMSSTTILSTMNDSQSASDTLLPNSSSMKLNCLDFQAWDRKYNNSSEEMIGYINEFLAWISYKDSEPPLKYTIIIILYALIIVVSFIGNLFVVWAIFSKKRTQTTVNIFIGNLACSDLIMTIFNIPFTVARLLMTEFIFGSFVCHVAPFIQATSVYVSTLTMSFIAIDRFQAILRPMKPRVSSKVSSCLAIVIIWMTSCIFSLPFLLFNRLVEDGNYFSTKPVVRCQVCYPEPHQDLYKKSINVATFVLQFAIPLTIMVCLYTKIGMKIWSRVTIGATTREQEIRQLSAKRRTIVMLLVVAIVFVLCWLPFNLYHLLTDFGLSNDFNTFIVVHWIAMSSVCYNPFIYFWLNRRRFEQILRPGLMALCKRTCCGCYSTLFCPVKYDASPDTSPAHNGHELRRMRSCKRCHHGYYDDHDGNAGKDVLPNPAIFSETSEKLTGREIVRTSGTTLGQTPKMLSTNLNSSHGSLSISHQVNSVDVPISGKTFVLKNSCSNSSFNHYLSAPGQHQTPKFRTTTTTSSKTTKCFSFTDCPRKSLSDETASLSKQSSDHPNNSSTQESLKTHNHSENNENNNKITSSLSDSSNNMKKIWRYRNYHTCIKKRLLTNNHTTTSSTKPNNQVNCSISEGVSSGSSTCSSVGRGDRTHHHHHHISCHFGKPVYTRRHLGTSSSRHDMTLTSV